MIHAHKRCLIVLLSVFVAGLANGVFADDVSKSANKAAQQEVKRQTKKAYETPKPEGNRGNFPVEKKPDTPEDQAKAAKKASEEAAKATPESAEKAAQKQVKEAIKKAEKEAARALKEAEAEARKAARIPKKKVQ